MSQKIKNKINGMLLMNILFLGSMLIYMKIMMQTIQASLWVPAGAAPRTITAIKYSWTNLTLVISETAKYHDNIIVNNPIFVGIIIAVLYNVYIIIRISKIKENEVTVENKTI